MPELVQLRRAQASTALNQAVSLRPDLAQAHLGLVELYQELGYLDLSLKHLRIYHDLSRAAGDGVGHHAVQSERCQQQRRDAKAGR